VGVGAAGGETVQFERTKAKSNELHKHKIQSAFYCDLGILKSRQSNRDSQEVSLGKVTGVLSPLYNCSVWRDGSVLGGELLTVEVD
jgi:hypothetical protein